MRKILIALIMATIAISLYPLANADVGDSGYFGSTTTTNSFSSTADYWYASPFALNVDANVTEMHVYINGFDYDVKFFIYSLDGGTYYYSSDTTDCSAGAKWVNVTGFNVQLMAGTYLLGVRTQGSGMLVYKSVGNGMNGTVAYNAAWSGIAGVNTNFYMAIYANYTQAVVDTSEVTAQMISSDWLTFSALMALSLISLILAWKSNVPIINFVFGVVTLGTAAYYLGSNIVFAGWINILAILMASLCMLSGAMKLRDT